ncbi:MAG: beta-galactosidase [Syntrophaceticus sp.]
MRQLQFPLGVNYWPAGKAMYWWQHFEAAEVEDDFCKLADAGFQVVRIFLTWEDFQPTPSRVSTRCLNNLVAAADLADGCKIMIQPTFFCGHMSGVNWMPDWMLDGPAQGRFPVMSGGSLSHRQIRNFYSDQETIKAQKLLCREVAEALRGHPALWAYDLGNESSNCVVPQDRQAARDWLAAMVGELKMVSDTPVTIGLHAEDLEEDRKLGPADAAAFCDFLCMHGYPFYLDWVEHPLDVDVLPFLGLITGWLGGKRVLFQEFGVSDQILQQECSGDLEEAGAFYYQRALHLLEAAGMWGAFAWCYSDYQEHLFEKPPFKENPHERYFGLYKADGSPKKAVGVFRDFAEEIKDTADSNGVCAAGALSWLQGEDPERFYENPLIELKRLYRCYKKSLGNIR